MHGKKLLLGISGGIAAYKTLTLIRFFVKNGNEVKVVCTANALKFVTQLALETLSGNDVYCNMFDTNRHLNTEHIALTQWADCAIIAPATANIIGKIAHGIADDALSTVMLAFDKPVFFAPAMNENMYQHSVVVNNMKTLQRLGYQMIDSQVGFLACHNRGKGRMAEAEIIYHFVDEYFIHNALPRKKALVTAGPTYEPIDSVRFIGNYSSGKMGFAIAEELATKGFDVDLITGHTHLEIKSPLIHRIDIHTAQEMYEKCMQFAHQADVIVMAAAVSDYMPETAYDYKLKKRNKTIVCKLKPTIDILANLGNKKMAHQILVGFALETNHEIEHAKKKLYNKNLDFIVLNSLNDEGAGFGTNTNKITILNKNGDIVEFSLKSKQEVASDIVDYILCYIN
jgi:phosphopantothenoylcysteine decarboxylase/phosphopantothenate--cysteine ligase